VTLDSKVIGVDTAASSSYSFSTDGSEGYTIPINTALGVAHQITGGKASATIHLGQTGFLGVRVSSAASSGTSLSPFGNSGTSGASGASGVSGTSGSQATTPGAYVESTVSGSPAAAAGLVSGDTITAVNGHTITSPDGLSSQLSGYHPGDKVSISWTDSAGATHTATVTLAKGPAA
jgi:S1-C subfamily serine protease